MMKRIKKLLSKIMNRSKNRTSTPSSQILFRHISKLPLSIFIEVLCDENYSLLGTGTQSEIFDAWQVLVEQYNDSIGGIDIFAKLEKVKKIYILESKTNRGKQILLYLSILQDNWVHDQMYSFNYPLPVYVFSEDNLKKLAKKFEAHLKRDIMELSMLVTDFNNSSDSNKNEVPKREDFINTLVSISKHFAIALDEEKISVEKYCAYVRRYNQDIERLISQQQTQH